MSERIHAFGENGELSDGAQLAFDQFMSGTVNPAIASGGVVSSVNGETGAVVLDAADVGARPSTYVPAWTEITGKPATFPPSTHTHDDLYYTEAEVNTALAGKAATSHTHTASQVSDLSEAVDDRVAALIVAGTGITKTYDDAAGTLTLAASGGGPLTGTGFPEGIVTAPVGTEYVDLAATNGAIKWIKKTGTGNTGWVVTYGDTGRRNITALCTGATSGIFWQRTAEQAVYSAWIANITNTNILTNIFDKPLPQTNPMVIMVDGNLAFKGYASFRDTQSTLTTTVTNGGGIFYLPYQSRDPWPTTLPGTAA